ncbi:MAG: lipoprotein [Thalassolituus sp.]
MRALTINSLSILSLIVITLTSTSLSACGQKGPLYLPSTAQTPEQEQ